MKKQERKTAVFYNELEHLSAMSNAYETTVIFKDAKEDLETILGRSIQDFEAFRKDILGHSLAEIKKTYPKAFDLGLPIEKTLKLLSIDLRKIERADAVIKTTPHKFCVCPKTGLATPDENKEPYIQYAITDEQHERLDFAEQLVAILEKAHTFKLGTNKANLTNGISHLVAYDPQKGLIPNHFFVLEGIE